MHLPRRNPDDDGSAPDGVRLNVVNRSVPPVRAAGEAVVRAASPLIRNPSSAVPCIAAVRASVGGGTKRRLDGEYREYAHRLRMAPTAANLTQPSTRRPYPVWPDGARSLKRPPARSDSYSGKHTSTQAASSFDAGPGSRPSPKSLALDAPSLATSSSGLGRYSSPSPQPRSTQSSAITV